MALNFAQFHGQPGVLAELSRSFQAGSVVHAFILHGDAGCGKKTLAMTLSMALHCENAGERPCMQCGPCQRMLAGSHPDHVVLRREKDKTTIPVDAVRSLIDSLSEKPYEGGFRTVIIEEADKMNDNAQNALLKTLEEPDGRTVFFLLTAHPEGLLTTVRSRCRAIFLPRLDEEVIAQGLMARGIEAKKAAYVARLSRGVLGRAIELCGEDAYYADRDEALSLLQSLQRKENLPKVSMAWDDKRKPEDSLRFLSALESVLSDTVRVKTGLAPMDAAVEDALESIAQVFTIDALACIMEETVAVRKRVLQHVQWRSAAEPLLLRIVEGIKL